MVSDSLSVIPSPHTFTTFSSPTSPISAFLSTSLPFNNNLLFPERARTHTHTEGRVCFGVRRQRRPYVLFAAKVSLILPVQQSERGARLYCSPTPLEGRGEEDEGVRGGGRDGWEAEEERDKLQQGGSLNVTMIRKLSKLIRVHACECAFVRHLPNDACAITE